MMYTPLTQVSCYFLINLLCTRFSLDDDDSFTGKVGINEVGYSKKCAALSFNMKNLVACDHTSCM